MRPRGRAPAPAVGALLLFAVLGACDGSGPLQPVHTPSQTTIRVTPSPSAPPEAPTGASSATQTPSRLPATLTSQALRDVIDADWIEAHLANLQSIADAHGGNRAAGTTGFDASAAYVADLLEQSGYRVQRHDFTFPFSDPASGVTHERTSFNLLAELAGEESGEVVLVGAHLDSVPAGPGINDNGSGSMTLLELALLLPTFDAPDRTIRFAFWGAEEGGPFGSAAYVESLTDDERRRVVAYLNLDMLGSPNHIRFVYSEADAAPGSDTLTDLFARYFEAMGLAWEPIDLTGHGDHGPFVRAGIPTGGVFAGGSEAKTDAQAADFGGTPGEPADPCAHFACDTLDNVSSVALDEMADAAAHAVATLAYAE